MEKILNLIRRSPRTLALLIPISVAALVVGCANLSSDDHNGDGGHAHHWSYTGSTGPEHWGDLRPDYAVLKDGKEQSPIDLVAGSEQTGIPLAFHYGSSQLNLVNNGHTIQQNCDPGSYVTYNGRRYELKQFHFHSKSEHTVNRKRFDLEMYLVHQAGNGEFLVVGILFKKGAANSFLDQFWNRIPGHADETVTDPSSKISIGASIPSNSPVFAYDGSFTTPPGTEGVKWFVFSEPRTLSFGQLAKFRKLYRNNYRTIQPLNDRTVTLFK